MSFVLLFTMFPQVLLGFYSKKKDTFHWTRLHRGLGYFVVGTACWQMWLGMQLFETDTRLVQCFYAWLISVGVCSTPYLQDLQQLVLQVAFHFAADNVSIFEIKTHLVKKGFEVEDPTARKARRNSVKSRTDGCAPHLHLSPRF